MRKKQETKLFTSDGQRSYIDQVYPETLVPRAKPGDPLYDSRWHTPIDPSSLDIAREHGIYYPPVVEQSDEPDMEMYRVIDGRQRIKWAIALNLERADAGLPPRMIEVKVVAQDDAMGKMKQKHLLNEHATPRDTMGRIEGMVEMLEEGASVEMVCKVFRVVDRTVRRAKAVMASHPAVHQALREDAIRLVDALEIAALPLEKQPEAVRKIARRDGGDAPSDETPSGEAPPPKPNAAPRARPWRKAAGMYESIAPRKLDGKEPKHTDRDVAKAIRAALEYSYGMQDEEVFQKVLEKIGVKSDE